MPTKKDQLEALNRAVELAKEFIQAGSQEPPEKLVRNIFNMLIEILNEIENSGS